MSGSLKHLHYSYDYQTLIFIHSFPYLNIYFSMHRKHFICFKYLFFFYNFNIPHPKINFKFCSNWPTYSKVMALVLQNLCNRCMWYPVLCRTIFFMGSPCSLLCIYFTLDSILVKPIWFLFFFILHFRVTLHSDFF